MIYKAQVAVCSEIRTKHSTQNETNVEFFNVTRDGYSDWLQAGRSGDRIPAWGEIFRTCPDRPWGPPSLLYNGYRVFPGGKERPGRDADPTPHPLVVPWSRKSRAISLLSLWTVRPVQSLSACTRVHFTCFLHLVVRKENARLWKVK